MNQTDGEELMLVMNGGGVTNEILHMSVGLDHTVQSQQELRGSSDPLYHFNFGDVLMRACALLKMGEGPRIMPSGHGKTATTEQCKYHLLIIPLMTCTC